MDENADKKVITLGYLNKLRYISKFKKQHCKQYSFQLSKENDARYIAALDAHKGDRVAYIRKAIDFYEANNR